MGTRHQKPDTKPPGPVAVNDAAVDRSNFGEKPKQGRQRQPHVPPMADQATEAESKFRFVQITSLLLRLQITSLCAAL